MDKTEIQELAEGIARALAARIGARVSDRLEQSSERSFPRLQRSGRRVDPRAAAALATKILRPGDE